MSGNRQAVEGQTTMFGKAMLGGRNVLARCLLLAVATLAFCWPAAGDTKTGAAKKKAGEPEYVLVTAKSKTIKGVFSFVIHAPQSTAKTWVVMTAQAPELPGQKDTSTRLMPGGEPFVDLSPRKRSLLRAVIPVTDAALEHELSGRIECQATLYSRVLARREPGESYPAAEKLSGAERKLALAQTPTVDFSSADFQHWLKDKGLRKKPNETDLDFGRRAFLSIRQMYGYEIAPNMDRHASVVCQHDKADCGGLSLLFTATLRANKIPARALFGRWAQSSKSGAMVGGSGVTNWQQHVKAEFYAKGIGWTPVDVSRSVTVDKSPEGLRYFGNDPGDFFVVHVDPDFEVDSGLYGLQSPLYMQPLTYYAKGEGSFKNLDIDRDWQVETVE